MHRTEVPSKILIHYLRHTKTLGCHMCVIYIQQQLTWPCIQCVHINHLNMHCHTGNVCCVVVPNISRIDLTDQELDKYYFNASPSIFFHTYHLIARCKVHGRHPLDKNKMCCLCFQDPATVTTAKLYSKKELVMMEIYLLLISTQVSIFHQYWSRALQAR